jgi:hypothetical protein
MRRALRRHGKRRLGRPKLKLNGGLLKDMPSPWSIGRDGTESKKSLNLVFGIRKDE